MTLKCRIIIILAFVLLIVGCKNNEPSQTVGLPVSICLPTNEVMAANRMPARRQAIGDPGAAETFLLPNYIYFIVMKQSGDNWVLWQTIERQVNDADWQPTRYAGSLQNTGDSIFLFTETLNLLLSNEKINGRVYAVASAVPLTFNISPLSNIANLNDLLTLTFSAASATVQENLQHIYSTPYNYEVSGDYYGSFSSLTQRVPHVHLMLYHVAAKVDIKWSVALDKRINSSDPSQAVRLTHMEARRLFNGNAYCFKPMHNTMPALIGNGQGYDVPIISSTTDEGQWWEGRAYFYTIPYTIEGSPTYFPLQMLMRTNGTSDDYRLTLYQPFNVNDVFVPWLRGNFTFNSPLEDKDETKTIPAD